MKTLMQSFAMDAQTDKERSSHLVFIGEEAVMTYDRVVAEVAARGNSAILLFNSKCHSWFNKCIYYFSFFII